MFWFGNVEERNMSLNWFLKKLLGMSWPLDMKGGPRQQKIFKSFINLPDINSNVSEFTRVNTHERINVSTSILSPFQKLSYTSYDWRTFLFPLNENKLFKKAIITLSDIKY